MTEYQRGFPTRKWKKIYRNEALDCRVYATAALLMREVNWKAVVKKKDVKQAKPKEEVEKKELIPSSNLIHVVFTRGIRWKGNHVGPGIEMDVSIQEARELQSLNAIRDVKLPIDQQPMVAFKVPSTKQLRREQRF